MRNTLPTRTLLWTATILQPSPRMISPRSTKLARRARGNRVYVHSSVG